MESAVSDQLKALIAALVTGAALGVLCDLMKLVTPRSRTLSALLTELPFLLFGAFAVFVLGQRSGAGMRLYFLLSASAGFFLYLGILHQYVSACFSKAKHYLHDYTETVRKKKVSICKQFRKGIKNKEK